MGDWRRDTGYRAVRVKGHESGCTKPCCVRGDNIPLIPGEKRWQRYILPGIVITALLGGAIGGYFWQKYHTTTERTYSPSKLESSK